MKQLENKVYIITGATGGIGGSTARLFANEGARLILNGRNKERGEAIIKELNKDGTTSHFCYGNVGSEKTSREMVNMALNSFGKLDGIICHAGMLGLGSVAELSLELWKETFRVNVDSVFNLSRFAVPEFLKRGEGVIILNASIAAFKAFPKHPAYCASKAAVQAFGRQMALEYGPKIRVAVICPGPIDTPLISRSIEAFENPESIIEETRLSVPLKRLGKPSDIAELVLFLSSDKASWITGSSIIIDGGKTV